MRYPTFSFGPVTISVSSNNAFTFAYLDFYTSKKEPDIHISFISCSTKKEYDKMFVSSKHNILVGKDIAMTYVSDADVFAFFYYSSDSEELLISRMLKTLFARYVLDNRIGIPVHGACINTQAGGFLFCGMSGEGKSTVAKLAIDAGISCISDDYILLVCEGEGYTAHSVYATIKKEKLVNVPVLVSKIIVVNKSDEVKLKTLSRKMGISHVFGEMFVFPFEVRNRYMSFVYEFLSYMKEYALLETSLDATWDNYAQLI